jgi:hypothetical protein
MLPYLEKMMQVALGEGLARLGKKGSLPSDKAGQFVRGLALAGMRLKALKKS